MFPLQKQQTLLKLGINVKMLPYWILPPGQLPIKIMMEERVLRLEKEMKTLVILIENICQEKEVIMLREI
ncbi:hypothetical protein D3C86_1887340 [compost metagenome]